MKKSNKQINFIMGKTKINCPNCGVDIDVDEVFKQKAEEDIKMGNLYSQEKIKQKIEAWKN